MISEGMMERKDNGRENVIYGADVFGRRLWKFLKDLEVPVHFFCQTEITDGQI